MPLASCHVQCFSTQCVFLEICASGGMTRCLLSHVTFIINLGKYAEDSHPSPMINLFFPYSTSCCSPPSTGWLACTVRLNWRFWLMFHVYPFFVLTWKGREQRKKKCNYPSSGPSWNVQNGEGESLNGREGGNLIDYNLNLAHSVCKWMHLLCKKVWVIRAGGMKGEWIKWIATAPSLEAGQILLLCCSIFINTNWPVWLTGVLLHSQLCHYCCAFK